MPQFHHYSPTNSLKTLNWNRYLFLEYYNSTSKDQFFSFLFILNFLFYCFTFFDSRFIVCWDAKLLPSFQLRFALWFYYLTPLHKQLYKQEFSNGNELGMEFEWPSYPRLLVSTLRILLNCWKNNNWIRIVSRTLEANINSPICAK